MALRRFASESVDDFRREADERGLLTRAIKPLRRRHDAWIVVTSDNKNGTYTVSVKANTFAIYDDAGKVLGVSTLPAQAAQGVKDLLNG